MYRAITMRVEPRSDQRRFLDESIRVHHYVYNAMITAVKLYFSYHGKLPSYNDLNRVCTQIWQNNPWMHGIYQNTMNQAAKRALDAFRSCNPGIKQVSRKKRDGNKKLERSNTFGYISNRSFKVEDSVDSKGKNRRSLSLGKMKGSLRCYNQSTPIRGEPKTVIISRKDLGTHYEYYATIQYG